MTNKSKNIAVISGTSFLCAVLVGVIAAQFTGGSKQQDYTAIETSPPEIVAKITTTTHYETTAPEILIEENAVTTKPADENGSEICETGKDKENTEKENKPAVTTEPAKKVVNQDFEPATKPTAPPPPKVKDEAVLTNMDEEPVYEPEVTVVTTAPPKEEPQNGEVRGDKIYVYGFGWIDYEGGGGIGEVNEQMYQNGNKIGYFG